MLHQTLDSQSCHSLADWLCYIEQNHPIHQIELGLDRVLSVASRADLNQLPGKVILIGGTNGKGTTARLIEQLLLTQGHSVGVYSSPHLLHFNERLRINNANVADTDWVAAFAFIEDLRAETPLTYFEFTTLVAFHILRQQKLNYCLIEVGLGGRLDATNIISPDVSVITTVDLDHQEWLGDNRESIGFEKAGIFRAQFPVVIGDLNPPESMLKKALELSCNLVQVQRHYWYEEQESTWHWHSKFINYSGLPIPAVPVQNAACALAILEQLAVLPEQAKIEQVLTSITLPGRMQWVSKQPAILLDVAHNPQSTAYLAQQLTKLKANYKRIIALVGMLKDKDITLSLAPLTQIVEQWHLVSLNGARGATAQQLADCLVGRSPDTTQYDDVLSAYRSVSAGLQAGDLLVVFGSFVTVSAVIAGIQETR